MRKLFKRAMKVARRSLRLSKKLGRGIDSNLDAIEFTKPVVFNESISIQELASNSGKPFELTSASRIDLNAPDGIFFNKTPSPRYVGVIESGVWRGSEGLKFDAGYLSFPVPFTREYIVLLTPQDTSTNPSVVTKNEEGVQLVLSGSVGVMICELP